MKTFLFITTEFSNGESLKYRIQAESLQEACEKASKLGILKGHSLREFNGKWIQVEPLMGDMYPVLRNAPKPGSKVVFYESEDYWSPNSLMILKREDCMHDMQFESRSRELSVIEGVLFSEAFLRAKEYCRFNHIPFIWNSITI